MKSNYNEISSTELEGVYLINIVALCWFRVGVLFAACVIQTVLRMSLCVCVCFVLLANGLADI